MKFCNFTFEWSFDEPAVITEGEMKTLHFVLLFSIHVFLDFVLIHWLISTVFVHNRKIEFLSGTVSFKQAAKCLNIMLVCAVFPLLKRNLISRHLLCEPVILYQSICYPQDTYLITSNVLIVNVALRSFHVLKKSDFLMSSQTVCQLIFFNVLISVALFFLMITTYWNNILVMNSLHMTSLTCKF